MPFASLKVLYCITHIEELDHFASHRQGEASPWGALASQVVSAKCNMLGPAMGVGWVRMDALEPLLIVWGAMYDRRSWVFNSQEERKIFDLCKSVLSSEGVWVSNFTIVMLLEIKNRLQCSKIKQRKTLTSLHFFIQISSPYFHKMNVSILIFI